MASTTTLNLQGYLKLLLRDEDPDKPLFRDSIYDSFFWEEVDGGYSASDVTARQYRSGPNYIYTCADTNEFLWQVEIETEVSGVEYRIDEGSRLVVVESGTESRTEFTVQGSFVNMDRIRARALRLIGDDPGKAGAYMAANGLTLDFRSFSAICRENAQHILGVHGA